MDNKKMKTSNKQNISSNDVVINKRGTNNTNSKNSKYISFLYKSLHKLSSHINELAHLKLIEQDEYNIKMNSMYETFAKVKELDELIQKKKNVKTNFEIQNSELILSLRNIILSCGSKEVSHIIQIFQYYNTQDIQNIFSFDMKEYLQILDHYFITFSVQIFDNENEKNKYIQSINSQYPSVESTSNSSALIVPFQELADTIIHVKPLQQTSPSSQKSKVFFEKLDGATILLFVGDQLIVLHGIFRKDSLGLCKYSQIYYKKMNELKDEIDFLDVPREFREKYMEQLSLRDFILHTPRELSQLIRSDYQELITLKNKTLSVIIKDFIKSPPEKQRKILVLFILIDDESCLNANIIFDLITSQNITYQGQPLCELLYKSFHWKTQKMFQLSQKTYDNNKKKIENLSIQDVPYETRIATLKVSEYVKSKAMDKVKEINGSKESSNKAQQWLDGFLKIPFGTFKKEPILIYFQEFQENLEHYINLLTIDTSDFEFTLSEPIEIEYFEIFKNIINEYHSIIIHKTEYSYELFLNSLSNHLNQIHNDSTTNIESESVSVSVNEKNNSYNHKPFLKIGKLEKVSFMNYDEEEDFTVGLDMDEDHDNGDNLLFDELLNRLNEENKEILMKMIEYNRIPDTKKIAKCFEELEDFRKLKMKIMELPDLNHLYIDALSKKLEEIEKSMGFWHPPTQSIQLSISPIQSLNSTQNQKPKGKRNDHFMKFIFKNKTKMMNFIEEWNEFKEKKRAYLNQVEMILDKCTYGQFEAKKQMKRLIAQWMNGNNDKGSVIGLQGPPGVGKTSLLKHGLSKCLLDENGQSRPLIFIPIGGSSNGAFLEGHNYTYLGSTWGKIVDAMMEAKCLNPIIFIDELDKVSKTEHGKEIASILTHITDETQNHEFFDRYFASIPLDLSKVLFVFSYNDRDSVDPILRDRIQEIVVDGLSKKEKIVVCKNYILPEIFKNVGFGPDEIVFTNQILDDIIEGYTCESGCRKIKEILLNMVRDINLMRINGESFEFPFYVSSQFVTEFMTDKPKVTHDKIHNKPLVGISNGLYAYSGSTMPGGVTRIQTLFTYNGGDKGKLKIEKISGLMGDSMKESVDVAFTVAYNLLPQSYKDKLNEMSQGLHILCGSISKKDGPSATAIICASIFSRLTGIPIRHDVACTGEMNFIDGSITKIGGLSSKCEGAILAGVKIVVICEENEEDLDSLIRKEKEEIKLIQKSSSMRNMDLSPIFGMGMGMGMGNNTDEEWILEDSVDRDEVLKNKYRCKKYKSLDVFVIQNIYELLDIILTEPIELNRYM